MTDMNAIILNDGQQRAVDTVMSGVNCFITGGAGTGKTYLTKAFIKDMQDQGKNVMVVAPTGVAASAVEGVTIHRGFGLPATVCINEKTMTSKVRVSKPLSIADTVVIDEVSMVRMDLFDSMMASIRKAEAKSGKHIQVVAIGDFCQLPPILKNSHGERKLVETFYKRHIGTPYAFLGNEWHRAGFVPVRLDTVVRQGDAEFIRNLNLARAGDMDCIPYFNSRCCQAPVPGAVHLYSTNSDVDTENLHCLNSIEGENFVFDTVFDAALDRSDIKDIQKQVVLKRGARVMVTTNDTHNVYTEHVGSLRGRVPYRKDETKFYNGSIGTVMDLGQYDDPGKDYVVVHLDSGPFLVFYRQSYPVYQYVTEDDRLFRRELGRYSQFPLRPAYAVTIHKSQGQTYESANIDPYCRNAGQLYVALSRVRSVDGIHLDYPIEAWNLVVDPAVRDFYEHLDDPDYRPWPAMEADIPVEEAPAPAEAPLEHAVEVAEEPPAMEYPEPQAGSPAVEVPEIRRTPRPPVKRKAKKKGTAPTPQGGRPPRFPTGATSMRIPNELSEALKNAIGSIYPRPEEGGMDTEKEERLLAFLKELNNS